MTLQYQLDSLDGLDESISKLYIEKDGKFILDVTGDEKPENKDLIPKSRLDQEIDKRKEAEKGLQAICDSMVEDVSEEKRSIIPDLAPSAKIVWLREARKQGIFEDRKAESIDSKRPGDKSPTDFKDMSPQAIMATGYNTTK
jgi:hypothetical protein